MVIILPCAGGCAANFRSYTSNKEFCAYEYSGHWSRYEEPLEMSINQIACSIERDLEKYYYQELYLFGHSMGGLIAWQLAHKLITDGFRVKALYVAACCPPGIRPDFIENINNDSDIKKLLGNIRQVPDRVLNSAFFNEDLLPIIRNDFNLVKEYIKGFQDVKFESLSVPIICLCGANDPVVDVEEMRKWEKYTSKEFKCIVYPGNHFFVYDKSNVGKIVSQIIGENY